MLKLPVLEKDGKAGSNHLLTTFSLLVEGLVVVLIRRLLNTPVRIIRNINRYLQYKGFRLFVICVLLLALLFVLYYCGAYFLEVTRISKKVKPKSLLGYPHCHVNASTFSQYSHQYHCNLKNLPKEETLVFTFINSAWISLAQNWVCSAKKMGLGNNLYLISFEKGVCKSFAGASCFEYPNSSFHETTFGEDEYQKLVIKRTEIILEILACNYKSVMMVDADVVFLQNPLNFLQSISSDLDIVFQTDTTSIWFLDFFVPYIFRYICGGVIYMKPTTATKYLWMSVLQYQKHFLWNDQAGLNVCIRHSSQTVLWNTLSSELFPNGPQFFINQQDTGNSIITHANHIAGKERIIRMVGSGIWCDRESAMGACRNTTLREHCSSFSTFPTWCTDFVDICKERYSVDITRQYAITITN